MQDVTAFFKRTATLNFPRSIGEGIAKGVALAAEEIAQQRPHSALMR